MKWYLYWEMDGCQWIVENIMLVHLAATPPNIEAFTVGTYKECMEFIYCNLIDHTIHYTINPKEISIICPEGTYYLTHSDIREFMKINFPEKII